MIRCNKCGKARNKTHALNAECKPDAVWCAVVAMRNAGNVAHVGAVVRGVRRLMRDEQDRMTREAHAVWAEQYGPVETVARKVFMTRDDPRAHENALLTLGTILCGEGRNDA